MVTLDRLGRLTTHFQMGICNVLPYHNDGYRDQDVFLQVRYLTGLRVHKVVPSRRADLCSLRAQWLFNGRHRFNLLRLHSIPHQVTMPYGM